MKNLTLIIAVLLSSTLVISGCKKDDADPTNIYQSSLINPSFEELQAFYEAGYDGVNGNIELSGVNGLSNMLTLSNIKLINGSLKIEENRDLISLEGLNKLHSIGGELYIDKNKNLEHINDLGNLESVGSNLVIGYYLGNNHLTSLDGLNKVQSVGGFLTISSNYILTDLCGIKNVLTLGGVANGIRIDRNLYNPTEEDIIAGNCSQ